jgi:hypothetical protein
VTYEELLDFARAYTGLTLETVRGRRFRVATYLDSIVFVPVSTGLGRSDGRKAGEAFVERYAATHSTRPGDYGDVSRNASYYLPLLDAALAARSRPLS